jgi:hypothetical protein
MYTALWVPLCSQAYTWGPHVYRQIVEERLAEKAEPVLGFKPSSKFKSGPIGILIYVVCGIIAFFSLRSAGVF